LQFSEAAVRAIREAEPGQNNHAYRVTPPHRTGGRSGPWFVALIALSAIFILNFFLAAARSAAPVRAAATEQASFTPIAPESQPIESGVQEAASPSVPSLPTEQTTPPEIPVQSLAPGVVAPGSQSATLGTSVQTETSPQITAAPQDEASPQDVSQKLAREPNPYTTNVRRWRYTVASARISLYPEATLNAKPVAVIEQGTPYLSAETGYECGRASSWHYAFVPGVQDLLKGMVCTPKTFTHNLHPNQGEQNGQSIRNQQ
jgi:hypothetical protein